MVAAVALVLVYPASMPSARAPVPSDTPTEIIAPQYDDGALGFVTRDDDGDADDLAGYKRQKPSGSPGQSGFMIEARWALEVWAMNFFALGLCR